MHSQAKTNKDVKAMAKRRKMFARKAKRKSNGFKLFKKSKGRKSFGSKSVQMIQMDSMAYGAIRGQVANLLTPLTNMLPMGNIADEVGMGLVCYFAAKNTSGMVKDIAIKGLVIENARLGEALLSGLIPSVTGNSNKTSETFAYG